MPLCSNSVPDGEMQPYADNFIPVIPVTEASVLHDDDHQFCYDETCPCHQDEAALLQVEGYVDEGLLTPYEARLFVAGKTL